MINTRSLYFALLLTCFVHYTYGQHAICNSLEGYDTKALISAVQWQVTTDYACLGNPAAACTYYISFCQTAENCFHQYSACQNSTGASNMTVIGAYSTTIFHENESGPKGFYAVFPQGPRQNVSNTTICEPSLKIKFTCNLKTQWLVPIGDVTALAPEPDDVDVDDACLTTMTFDYPGACYQGKEPEKGMSGGAVFLLILFSVAVAYFLIGMAYNGFVKHKSGVNLIPQASFWIGLPIHIIEGFRTTLGVCTGSSKTTGTSYESV
ncbi:unnamed protein product [Adineta steineri]|uniref:Autophagy-related protein 27 n=1 Tax=Adineta steineri TaxID=433720 RepID=A0A814VWG8_9BILA|nr:unnamed protein product [Adineta steineri]CAF1039793.1 unnamed protein product [Adineta steineri]CAF1194202.1 unnamed protein product [Adineta steineri]CAF3758402.1 unnamed protein product [Adineta steineri]CAF3763924.1 unnamed protein product [Adineta steineri]